MKATITSSKQTVSIKTNELTTDELRKWLRDRYMVKVDWCADVIIFERDEI